MLLEDPHTPIDTAELPVVVQKYGGSSVADVDKLGWVADRIVATRRAGHHVVAVVSAMGQQTDELLGLARKVWGGGWPGKGDAGREPPRRELDMLVSTGERVAMSLLSIAIQARGLEAISFTGSQCGIITNDRHFDARIIEVRPHRIEDELARGQVVIVAGYQGMSYRREITTLGRGGSDTTAVALAAALSAERCEIYSDVDGVYSADPRVVPEARQLPELDHATLQAMAESGAKVVCAQAVEWARRAGIAIYARCTFDSPAKPGRQTIVRKNEASQQPRARAVTADERVVLAQLDRVPDADQLRTTVQQLTESGVGIQELQNSDGRLTMVLSVGNSPNWPAVRAKLLQSVAELRLHENVAMVSVVGGGLTDSSEPLLQLRKLLVELGATPHMLLASGLRLGAVIDSQYADQAQQRLHAVFVS